MQVATRRSMRLEPVWADRVTVLAERAPAATGRREIRADGTEWLVYRRRLRSAPDRVWAALTDAGEARRWLGTWRPVGPGEVEFRYAFEGDDVLPLRCSVDELVPRRRLAVTMQGPVADEDPEHFELELRQAVLHTGITELTVAQSVSAVSAGDTVPHLASGCEFYLDRLVALLEGRDPSALDFDDYFLRQAEHYRTLFPTQRERTAGS